MGVCEVDERVLDAGSFADVFTNLVTEGNTSNTEIEAYDCHSIFAII